MQALRYVSNNQNGRGPDDFASIAEAIESVPADNEEKITIFIRKGVYREKLIIDRPYISLDGENRKETIITFDDHATMIMEDGSKRGTFRTQTAFIDTHDIIVNNITFENSAGFGTDVGQAIALYADGDRIAFDNCNFIGSQDTLFTGPLPPVPFLAGGFTGPKEFAPRINGRQYYHNCLIRGDVDFIFGSATAFFDRCEIFSQKTDDLPEATEGEEQKTYGYITAASTAEDQEYGYVFDHCKLTSDCPRKSVYLGRPWRNFAKTVFMNCELGGHIRDEGWDDWKKTEARETIFFAEYNSAGPGAAGLYNNLRASFARRLTEQEALRFAKERVLRGNDGWSP
jgi:pectinesterase